MYGNGLANQLNQLGATQAQMSALQQAYQGVGSYSDRTVDGHEYIRVDKGTPDEAKAGTSKKGK